jgi:hypothetical protein
MESTDMEFNNYMNNLYSVFQLSTLLKEKDNDIEDPEFLDLMNKINPDLSILEMLDYELYRVEFDEMLEKTEDTERLAVLWKSAFKDVNIGDKINGGVVVGIFVFTIWIYKDEETGHKYCCPDSERKC